MCEKSLEVKALEAKRGSCLVKNTLKKLASVIVNVRLHKEMYFCNNVVFTKLLKVS